MRGEGGFDGSIERLVVYVGEEANQTVSSLYQPHISMQRERERENGHGLWHDDLTYLTILQWKEAMAPTVLISIISRKENKG